MALVTIQRSPSPSTENDLDTVGSSEDAVDGKSAIKRSLSDSYFTIKGAALILPNNEYSKKSQRKSHGGEIQGHLQAMLHLLRPEDKIKIAVRLEDVASSKYKRYMALVSTFGRQDTEESVILGIDCCKGETANIRLVLPIWLGVKLRLGGDGGFSLCTDQQAYLFNPVSVQAMWSAIQSLVKVIHIAEDMKYLQDCLTHTWVDYYRGQINSDLNRNSHWDVEGVEIFAPSSLSLGNDENESVKQSISLALRDVMMSVDLDETSFRCLRMAVEEKVGLCLKSFKSYFDEEAMRILGQMDAPSKILDYLYLGTEWNASNLDELRDLGIGYILNITQEIDNFFSGMFHYFNVRLYDFEESDLLKHWDKTYKFISKARDHGSKVLVHCKMGISRSASSVMAYLMKYNRWSVEEAYDFVKERRSCVRPNSGFMEQLHMYEAILSASNKRDIFRVKSDPNIMDDSGKEDEQYQGFLLGDSLFHVMSKPDWGFGFGQPMEQEEEWLKTNVDMEPGIMQMETDLETVDSRSGDSVEESHPDLPSPPPFGDASGAFSTPASSDPSTTCQSAVDTGGNPPCSDNSQQISVPCIDPSGQASGLQHRIKPDSSWIKTDTSEMDEDTSDSALPKSTSAVEGCILVAPEDASECAQSASSNVCNSSKNFTPVESQNEFHSGSSSQTFEAQQCCNDKSNTVDLFPKAATPPSHFSPTEDEATMTEEVKELATASNSTTQHSLDNLAALSAFDQNQNPMAPTQASDSTISVGSSRSFSENSEDASSQVTPSAKHVDVGVQEYFFREKIPWNPGKVQKIREGINRTGQMLSTTNEEGLGTERTCTSDVSEEAMEVVEGQDVPVTKGDNAHPQTASDEIPLEDREQGDEIMAEGSAVSLYDKEDIPLEPGTVLRTRMEIEERQRTLSEIGETTQTKPVLRTSSLKHSRDPTTEAESCRRRVSCGPVIEQASSGNDTELISCTSEDEINYDGGRISPEQMSQSVSAEEREEREQNDNVAAQEQGAVSLQVFGDDVTIESGFVKKHKMEIETKHDTRWKSSTLLTSSDSEDPCPLPLNKHASKMTKENSGDDVPVSVPMQSFHEGREEKAPVPTTISPPDFKLQKGGASHGSEICDISDSDHDTLSLIKEIGCVLSVRPHQEQHVEEEAETEQGSGEGKVKYFINKIEQHSEPLHPPRKIAVVESHSEEGMALMLSPLLSENPTTCARPKSDTRLDLGFIPDDSSTDDITSSSSSSSKLPATQNLGESSSVSEQSVVRHLVGRFEEKSPEEDFREASACKDLHHDSSNPTTQPPPFKYENSSQRSPRNDYCAGKEETAGGKRSSFPLFSKSTPPAGPLLSEVEEMAFLSKSDQTEYDELTGEPDSFSSTQPFSTTTNSRWRKSSHSSAFQATADDRRQQTFRPSSQRPRPKSADHIRDSRFFQEGEGAYPAACQQQPPRVYPDSFEEEKSGGSFLRQISEEGRKVRKLHGKTHPLSKLPSALPPQTRKSPFHNSM